MFSIFMLWLEIVIYLFMYIFFICYFYTYLYIFFLFIVLIVNSLLPFLILGLKNENKTIFFKNVGFY